MEEYIRLEEEKDRRHGRTFDWQTATFGKVKHYEDEDDCSIDFETEFPAIVFDNTIISSEPKVCPRNESELDFRISLDESDDEDYTAGSDRLIPDKGDLRDYWTEISSERDFLGLAPSYVLIQDPVRRLCHRMIAYSIFGRDRHLRRHVDGRKNGVRLSGGHFIGRLAMNFGLVSDEGLRGLQGQKRQQATAAGAHEVDEAGMVAEEVAEDIPTLAQAPPPPPPTLQPRTMSQRIERIEEELMDASGQTYQPFDRTLVGSSGLSFKRHVRPRTCDASTFAAPYTDSQPDL
nr:hypothetical protein [Tanacetum cinerariifolium]